ncbi:alternative oxidase-domain containing protein [Nitzschia inconspicua]|uniref:Alternative oxidase-domain containing protein n=1 Tax=Nitzschia inconspicua TaxID=303405 RepID=A0A9K3K4S6_9STRA|nr:alternative oxidase-domain containing protein [Nitzschia inconspicua]KAG7347107.1 alternative oxidase-domain containing protein [Nitzschia inconspicua]
MKHDRNFIPFLLLCLAAWSDLSSGLSFCYSNHFLRETFSTKFPVARSKRTRLPARFPLSGAGDDDSQKSAQSGGGGTSSRLSFLTKETSNSESDTFNLDNGKLEPTIKALKQQLERQQEDVEMTQMLLDRLEGRRTNAKGSGLNEEYLTDLAASLVAGVDYGFVSRSEGVKIDDIGGKLGVGPPANIWILGWNQFFRNLRAMKGEYEDEENVHLSQEQRTLQKQLFQLKLNSTAIWELETKDGPIQAPWIIKVPYVVLCWLLDVLFEGKYVPSRFFLLETVARMPYFSYITMLHLYETLGFYRRSADVKRIHFAEEINEYRHLLIMESLGGDQQWWVRFIAQHSAIVYFIVLCVLWMISPSLSYKFSELLETHAVNTYGQFLIENEEELRKLPPTLAAIEYYSFGAADPFYEEFQTAALSIGGKIRRPGQDMRNLYDVFRAIRADEADHVGTMKACLDEKVVLLSPSLERKILIGTGIVAAAATLFTTGDFGGTSDLLSFNPGDIALDGGSGFELDALLAGASAVISQVFGGGSDALMDAQEVAESVEAIEDSGVVTQFLSEGFAAGVLASKLISGQKAVNNTAIVTSEEKDGIDDYPED